MRRPGLSAEYTASPPKAAPAAAAAAAIADPAAAAAVSPRRAQKVRGRDILKMRSARLKDEQQVSWRGKRGEWARGGRAESNLP